MTTQELHNLAITIAHDIFINCGDLPTKMFAELPDNKLISCSRPFETDDEKQDTFNMYAVILTMTKAVRYSLFSGAWFAKEQKGPFRLPSQRSDQKEGVFISTRDREEKFFTCFEIKRPENQLVDAGMDGEGFDDAVNLFKRINPKKASSIDVDALAKDFNSIEKPDWYKEWDMDGFLRTQ